jgi:histidyl-tRNA synthetase
MSDFPKQLLESPSGFPDFSPEESIVLEKMLAVIRAHFARAGYSPLETPLVERPEVLTAKAEGEITTQIYGLRLLNPVEGASDEKGLALRYDHTIPLARYVATHARELAFPYRRYAIGKVLRGERAKDGRYREFIQADIDVVGDTELSPLHDAEMVAVIADIFSTFNIGPFTVRINNRKVLAALLRSNGVTDEQVPIAMRAIDRLEKVGREKTLQALIDIGIAEAAAHELLESVSMQRAPDETLGFLKSAQLDAEGERGIAELAKVLEGIRALGVNEERYTIDLSIARGLDYYTGTVYETRLDEHSDLGSIASGGRYEDLAASFTNQKYPGVGISIGVTRLLLRLIKVGLIEATASTIAPVLVTTAEPTAMDVYLQYAATLRAANIACEIYLADKALDKQLHFADRKGFSLALIAKQEQLSAHTVMVRNLKTGEQQEVPVDALIVMVKKSLA